MMENIEYLFNNKAFWLLNSKHLEESNQNYLDLFETNNWHRDLVEYKFLAKKREHYEEAIRLFSLIIKVKPIHIASFVMRGITKIQLLDFIAAIEDFSKAIKIDSRCCSAYYFRGRAKGGWWGKNSKKDSIGEIEDLTKAIQNDPNFLSGYLYRGDAKLSLKDYTGAVKDYTKAIEINANYLFSYPRSGTINSLYSQRAFAKKSLKDYTGAIEDFTDAIHINPNNTGSYYYRGEVKLSLKDFIGAIGDFTKAIQLKPDFAYAYFNRGNAKLFIKDYSGAIADYNKATEYDYYFDHMLYFQLGKAKYLSSNYSEAITLLTIAIGNYPHYPESFLFRGLAKAKIGDNEGATEDRLQYEKLTKNAD